MCLNELERRLDPACFRRGHRAHIVSLDPVSAIRRYDERRLSVRLAHSSGWWRGSLGYACKPARDEPSLQCGYGRSGAGDKRLRRRRVWREGSA